MIRDSFAVFPLSPLLRKLPFMMIAAVLSLAAARISQAACPVPNTTKPYIEEIVSDLVLDATFVTANVHAQDRGFALSLFGVDKARLGQLLLAQECTQPQTFDPFYEEFGRRMTSFLQLVCEARGTDVIKVAIASTTEQRLSAFHFLRYNATRYPGRVDYNPYPSVDWRTIKSAGGNFFVSAAVFRGLTFTPTGGAPIDLTHVGTLSGTVVKNQATASTVYALFPSVTASGQPLVVNARVDENGVASGNIRVGRDTLATISGTGFGAVVTWQDNCAPAGP